MAFHKNCYDLNSHCKSLWFLIFMMVVFFLSLPVCSGHGNYAKRTGVTVQVLSVPFECPWVSHLILNLNSSFSYTGYKIPLIENIFCWRSPFEGGNVLHRTYTMFFFFSWFQKSCQRYYLTRSWGIKEMDFSLFKMVFAWNWMPQSRQFAEFSTWVSNHCTTASNFSCCGMKKLIWWQPVYGISLASDLSSWNTRCFDINCQPRKNIHVAIGDILMMSDVSTDIFPCSVSSSSPFYYYFLHILLYFHLSFLISFLFSFCFLFLFSFSFPFYFLFFNLFFFFFSYPLFFFFSFLIIFIFILSFFWLLVSLTYRYSDLKLHSL